MNKKLRNKITVFVSLLLSCQNKASASDVVTKNTDGSHSVGVNNNKSPQSFLDKLDNNPAFKLSIIMNGLFVTGIATYAILKHIVGGIDKEFEKNRKKLEERKENETEKLRCLVDKFLEFKEWNLLSDADNLCCHRMHTMIYAKKYSIELGPKGIIPFLKFKDKSFGELDKQSDFHLYRLRDAWKTFRKFFKVENTVYDNQGYAAMKLNYFSTLDGDMCIVIVYDHKNKIPISLNLIIAGTNNNYSVCCNSVECQWTWIYNKAK